MYVCVCVCMHARPQEHRHENMHGADVTSKHEKHLPYFESSDSTPVKSAVDYSLWR